MLNDYKLKLLIALISVVSISAKVEDFTAAAQTSGKDSVLFFEQDVLKSDKPVIIKFYSKTCPPCKLLAPVLEEISNEHADVRVIKVDGGKHGKLAKKHNVRGYPTIIYFKNGKEVHRHSGGPGEDSAAAKSQSKRMIKQNIKTKLK